MAAEALKKVAVLQGNATVAGRMCEFLEKSQGFEVERLEGSPPGATRAQLAIIDVDSGLDEAEQWIHHCDGRQLPVLISGVERSREGYADRPWLSRPFSSTQLITVCRELLGLSGSEEAQEDTIPPPIEVEPDTEQKPTVEIPTGLAEEESGDEPSEHELPTTRAWPEELLESLDLDASGGMILEMEEVSKSGAVGGELVAKEKRRRFEAQELFEENPWANEPDTAVEQPSPDDSAVPIEPTRREPSAGGAAPSLKAGGGEVTAISALGDMSSNDFSGAHRVASLVAEHWDRLGLTARPTDRADRLQRVLTAMLREGLDGVLDELKRIPAVSGFSGCLQTLPVVDLLHTVRDRKLRGRLEVGLDGHSFVLYVDHNLLQGIDSLGENTAGLLVDFLHRAEALDENAYRHYRRLVKELSGEPLEMKLRRDGMVDEDSLWEAKRERAKYLLSKLCQGQHGTFAFIDVSRDSGQAWPTKGLRLNVDALLLELYRKGTLDADQARPITRSALVPDSERAAKIDPQQLTEGERQILEFFKGGRSVDSAQGVLSDGDESAEEVIQRLRRLELLRRLGEDKSPPEPTNVDADREPAAPVDEQDRPTAVSSSWNLQILDEVDGKDGELPDNWAGPTEETQEDVGFSVGIPEPAEDVTTRHRPTAEELSEISHSDADSDEDSS